MVNIHCIGFAPSFRLITVPDVRVFVGSRSMMFWIPEIAKTKFQTNGILAIK
jgi:hypothetical protein